MEADSAGEFVRFDQVKNGIGQLNSILGTILKLKLRGLIAITLDDLNASAGCNIEYTQGMAGGKKAIVVHCVDAEPIPESEFPAEPTT